MHQLQLLSLVLALTATPSAGPTPTPTPNVHPGYWQVQPGIYVPCDGIKPFVPFVNIQDQQTYYLGGDVNANIAHPNLYGTYIDAIYYNHTRAYYDANGLIIPIFRENGPPNWYPAPSTTASLCTQWTQLGNTSNCPGGVPVWYTSAFMDTEVWQLSYNVYKPSIVIACNGQPVNSPTPTMTFTPPLPTATPTPAMGNPGFTDYVEAIYVNGITGGCGGGNFCPVRPITRQENAVWLWKAFNGGTPPPPCIGIFKDQPCYTRTPTPTPAH